MSSRARYRRLAFIAIPCLIGCILIANAIISSTGLVAYAGSFVQLLSTLGHSSTKIRHPPPYFFYKIPPRAVRSRPTGAHPAIFSCELSMTKRRISDTISVAKLQKAFIRIRSNCCLDLSVEPRVCSPYRSSMSTPLIEGLSYFADGFTFPGRVPFDLHLMQVLRTMSIQRLFIRPPCGIHEVTCNSWSNVYAIYYSMLLHSSGSLNSTVYIREDSDDDDPFDTWTPMQLHPPSLTFTPVTSSDLALEPARTKCFQRLIDYETITAYSKGISVAAVQRFKASVRHYLSLVPVVPHIGSGNPVVVFAYRGYMQSRHLGNYEALLKTLAETLPSIRLLFLDTSSAQVSSDQRLRILHESSVVISMHGDFPSNLVYMSENALVVQLRGKYPLFKGEMYNDLAKLFHVYLSEVYVSDLKTRDQDSCVMSAPEMERIAAVIGAHMALKPSCFTNNSSLI